MSHKIDSTAQIAAESMWIEAHELNDDGWHRLAYRLFYRAAQLGHVDSMNSVAVFLDDIAIGKRSADVQFWLRRAVLRGSNVAAWNLAMHYGAKGQKRLFLAWLRKSAHLGDFEAIKLTRRIKAPTLKQAKAL
jgi:TPR repeat protein